MDPTTKLQGGDEVPRAKPQIEEVGVRISQDMSYLETNWRVHPTSEAEQTNYHDIAEAPTLHLAQIQNAIFPEGATWKTKGLYKYMYIYDIYVYTNIT
jgi:hypothetical protein